MRKTNKDQVYVINQPKHILSSIIVVGDEFPLTTEIHDDIEKLCEISDVLFIYAPKHFTHQEEINFDKFASLYRSCAWIESRASLGSTLIRLFEYDKEVFQCHRSTIIMNSWNLGDIDTDKIMSILSSTLSKPILKIERLGSEEFYDIYKWDRSHPILRYITPLKDRLERAFCSYRSTSDLVFLREHTIGTLCKFYNTEDDRFPHDYINSFTEDDIRYLLGSIIRYLDIDDLNMNYKTLRL